MNDAKRFVVCFPLSAKLDYRFVVQVIRFFAVVHVVLCLRRKNIIYIVVSLSCHTRHQIPTHQTQYTFIRNAFAFGYCFALFTRSTLDLFVCLFVFFPVIFIYLYVVSTQSSWWSARRGQRKPKQPKCRRENENKNNNLISFHGTFFSIVRLLFSALDALWSTSRPSLVLRASLCVAHCFFFVVVVARFVSVILFCTFSIGLYWIASFVWQKRSVKWRRSLAQHSQPIEKNALPSTTTIEHHRVFFSSPHKYNSIIT